MASLFPASNLATIDHDPSSTSAKTSFHGTAISLTQHRSESNTGLIRRHEHVTHDDTLRDKTIKPLPETYTVVYPAAYYNENPPPLRTVGFLVPDDTLLRVPIQHRLHGWTS